MEIKCSKCNEIIGEGYYVTDKKGRNKLKLGQLKGTATTRGVGKNWIYLCSKCQSKLEKSKGTGGKDD